MRSKGWVRAWRAEVHRTSRPWRRAGGQLLARASSLRRSRLRRGSAHGKTFASHGTMETMSRPDAEALVRKLGGKGCLQRELKTDYVVPGRRWLQAREGAEAQGRSLTRKQFLALVPK